MQKLLDGISLKEITKPVEIYVFTNSEDRFENMRGPALGYTIRSDEELITALEMEVYIVWATTYEFKEFMGWRRLSEDSYEFRLSCIPSEHYRRNVYSLYLHRIIKVNERLEWVKLHWAALQADLELPCELPQS